MIKILLCLSLVILSYEQLCITGKNCPLEQGDCIVNVCKCKDGFKNLIDKSIPVDQQVYCNYAQKSHFLILIIEFLGTGIGHFLIGNYWLGLFKLLLITVYFSTRFHIFGDFKPPEIMIFAFKKLFKKEVEGFQSSKNEGTVELIYDLDELIFKFVYIIDLMLLLFNFQTDGYGIPLV